MMGTQTAVNKRVNFTGTLAQARRIPDREHIYLLFRTEAGVRICHGKDTRLLQTMRIGTTYHIKGMETTIGQKTYLQIISLNIARPAAERIKRRAGLIAAVAGLFLIIVLGGINSNSKQTSLHGRQTNSPDINLQHDQPGVTTGADSRLPTVTPQKPGSNPEQSADTIDVPAPVHPQSRAETAAPSTEPASSATASPEPAPGPAQPADTAATQPPADTTPPPAENTADNNIVTPPPAE